jgi:hypothetical protein
VRARRCARCVLLRTLDEFCWTRVHVPRGEKAEHLSLPHCTRHEKMSNRCARLGCAALVVLLCLVDEEASHV